MPAAALGWQHELLAKLDGRDELRVSIPLTAVDGSLVVDGWTAWRFEPGDHHRGQWLKVVDVGRRFHAAVSGEPEPGLLSARTDRWAIADKVAWEELPATRWAAVEALKALFGALEPVTAPSQLIHGDLTGNVLYHDALPPLVIDLSPYWRPPPFATAIVAADALVFEGADARLIDQLLDDPQDLGTGSDEFPQHLARALICRAVAASLAAEYGLAAPADLDAYHLAADLALRLIRTV